MLCISNVFAEQGNTATLSLKECVERAVKMNFNVSQAELSREKNAHKKAEILANLLPQIDINAVSQDSPELPVTMLPIGKIMHQMQPGMPADMMLPVSMGAQYNTSAFISANMVLYNQTILTALKLSKKGEYAATLGVEKAGEELSKEVAKLYFLIQTSAKQKQLTHDNIARLQQMTNIVKSLVTNGLGRQVDYNRIMVALQNLQTQWDNIDAVNQQQANMMKYVLEMPLETNIALTDSVNMPLLSAPPTASNDFSNHIDIRLLEAQKDMATLNKEMVNHGYIPSLVIFGQYGYLAYRQNFADYFNGNDNEWYSTYNFGLRLSIPIFDGLRKRAQYLQAKTDYEKANLTLDNTKKKFSTNYKTALNNYFNNKATVERQQNNINLAEEVYRETSSKYREGMATMSDLLQDEMNLSGAQANYLNALYKFKETELEILSLNGEIKSLTNRGLK